MLLVLFFQVHLAMIYLVQGKKYKRLPKKVKCDRCGKEHDLVKGAWIAYYYIGGMSKCKSIGVDEINTL